MLAFLFVGSRHFKCSDFTIILHGPYICLTAFFVSLVRLAGVSTFSRTAPVANACRNQAAVVAGTAAYEIIYNFPMATFARA